MMHKIRPTIHDEIDSITNRVTARPPKEQPTVHFRRQPNGSWAFDVPTTGQTYYAYRQGGTTTNHPWYVTRLDATNIPEALIAKGLATRTECVERAFEDAAHEQDLRE